MKYKANEFVIGPPRQTIIVDYEGGLTTKIGRAHV